MSRAVLLCAALAALAASGQAQTEAARTPTYESPTLEALIAAAAAENARVPELLRAYRARVETEMSLAVTDSAGRERAAQVEQIASEVRWMAPYSYDQRVVGYRTQAIGPTFSLMSLFGGWTTPTLYGNRLQLGVLPPGTTGRPSRRELSGMTIHPLSPERERYYTFAGADTVVVLFSRGRRIHVVSVRVTPRSDAPGDAVLFTGDMQLDADRKHVVRMRGRTVEIRRGRPVLTAGSGFPGTTGASFIELVNGEIDGAYWLPAYQRTEFHAHFALLGGFRVIVRIVSRFEDYSTNDTTWVGPEPPPGVGHHLTFAPSDSLSRFGRWRSPVGEVSADVEFADFEDVTPDAWRTQTQAVRFRPETVGEVFRFNRVEGLFTGAALRRDFGEGDTALSVRGSLGWAWAEQSARGNVSLEQRRGVWSGGVRAHRTLAHTNDFQTPLAWGATMSALLGSADDFDYLDRRGAGVFINRWLGVQRRSLFRAELGVGSDRAVEQNISRGLFVEGTGFRPNRGIREGDYGRFALSLELNPQVSGIFVDRGVGARVNYEQTVGNLSWRRLELRTAARRELGPLQLYARGDAGTLLGEPVPQALFEIGRTEGLTGYGYKEFVGDRAVMARAVLGHTFPVLRAPMRFGGIFVPGVAPGVAVGVHGAWTQLSSEAARRTALELGTVAGDDGFLIPLARPTDGVRGSVELLATFFSGAVAVGVARPLEGERGWRLTARIGQGF